MKTIEDYYCTASWQTRKIHITYKKFQTCSTLCNSQLQLSSYHSLKTHSTLICYSDYTNLCKTCIKKLPNNVREELIYTYVLAKVKK